MCYVIKVQNTFNNIGMVYKFLPKLFMQFHNDTIFHICMSIKMEHRKLPILLIEGSNNRISYRMVSSYVNRC